MSIEWNGRLRKIGTGYLISIPKTIVEELNLREGDLLNCTLNARLEYVKKEIKK